MRRISVRRPRFGCPRILDQLKKRRWRVNHKRIHRLWKQEKMQVPKKQTKRRRLAGHSGNLPPRMVPVSMLELVVFSFFKALPAGA